MTCNRVDNNLLSARAISLRFDRGSERLAPEPRNSGIGRDMQSTVVTATSVGFWAQVTYADSACFSTVPYHWDQEAKKARIKPDECCMH